MLRNTTLSKWTYRSLSFLIHETLWLPIPYSPAKTQFHRIMLDDIFQIIDFQKPGSSEIYKVIVDVFSKGLKILF